MNKISKALAAVVALGMVGVGMAGCASDPLSNNGETSAAGEVTVGTQNFPESELLGEIYSQALEKQGVKVNRKFDIGARQVILAALKDGSIDVVPEYNGALLSALLKGGAPEGVTDGDAVNKALTPVLPKGLEMLPMSAAEDKDVLAVTKATADKYNLTSIFDLTSMAAQWSIGAGPGWDEEYQGLVGLKDKYGLTFKQFQPLDAGGPLTVKALENNSIQVADMFSTDPTIASGELVSLKDPKNLFLAENIFPLIRNEKVNDKVKKALNGVSDKLTTDNLTKYLAEVVTDKKSISSVAKAFLSDNGLS